jgi:hypothetical protein
MSLHAKGLIWVLSGMMLWQSAVSAQDRCYRIAAAAGAGATAELMEVGAQIFSVAHLCATMLRLPQNRVRSMIEARELDGEIAIDIPTSGSNGLHMVPTPITRWQADLLWAEGDPEPLQNDKVIGLVLGQDWGRSLLANSGVEIQEVRDNRQLLEMLANRRIAAIILPRITARHFRDEFPILQHNQARKLTDLVVVLRLAPDFHDLVDGLDQSIRSLQANGFIDGVFKRYAR